MALMTMNAKSIKRRGRGPTRYPDLMGAARLVNYHFSHLARCLDGERCPARVAAALKLVNHPLAAQAEAAVARWTANR